MVVGVVGRDLRGAGSEACLFRHLVVPDAVGVEGEGVMTSLRQEAMDQGVWARVRITCGRGGGFLSENSRGFGYVPSA